MKVREIMTKNPVCCTPDTPLAEVARMMCEQDCGEIPVLENEKSSKPIGVVTDRDITCRTVAKAMNPLEMRAKDCMTNYCVTVNPDTSLEECCELLEENQIRRIVVVDAWGRCCGIVSQADIARHGPREKAAEVLQEVSQAS